MATGFLPVGNGSDISPTLLFFVAGGLFAFGGVIVTLLSGTTLAVQRRSRARPPSGPQPFGAQSGSLGLRLFARLIDGFEVAIVAMPLAFEAEAKSGRFGLVPALLFGLFFGLLAFAYVVAFEVSQGWTLGKKLLGMQVHGPSGAAKPTVRQSAVRNAFILLVIIPYVGGLLVIVACIVIAATIQSSPTKQGKHDQFAGGTLVATFESTPPIPIRKPRLVCRVECGAAVTRDACGGTVFGAPTCCSVLSRLCVGQEVVEARLGPLSEALVLPLAVKAQQPMR